MKRSTRPNVIVFLTDQQRHDTTGVHGNPLGLTPNFDRLARGGTHMESFFTCQPVCGPARSCLQSGMYATTSGCFRNGIPLPEGTPTLAHYYKEAGYDTGYIGKWHLAGEEPVTEPKRGGYDYWLGSELLEFASDAYDTLLFNNDNEQVKLPGYRVDAMTDAAIRYMDSHQQNPFFLFVSYLEPHHQNHSDNYPAPDVYADCYKDGWTPPDLAALTGCAPQHLPGYYGMVRKLDDALGRIMDTLKSLHMDEHTIVLFTSDHGNHFKTRNNGNKCSPHDSSVRVPAALSGSIFTEGGPIKRLVSLIDIPPTLLDACGIPIPACMQGRSILPLVESRGADWPEEVLIQISGSQVDVSRAIRTKRWKYAVHAPNKPSSQFMHADNYQEQYLFDLQSDPYELTNLAGMEPFRKIADELRDRLISRMEQAGEPRPVIAPAPVIPAKQRRVSYEELYRDRN